MKLVMAMIVITAIYHQHRYLTSVAHAQFGLDHDRKKTGIPTHRHFESQIWDQLEPAK
jgi:hypothetical protein